MTKCEKTEFGENENPIGEDMPGVPVPIVVESPGVVTGVHETDGLTIIRLGASYFYCDYYSSIFIYYGNGYYNS